MENSRKAIIFYGITLALAVAVIFLVPWIGQASLVLTMLTPTVAAVIMLAWIAPEGGFRKVLSLLGLDRAGLKGWPLAIGGPIALHLVSFLVLSIAGLAVFAAPQITGSVGFAVLKISTGLAVGTFFALGEETGAKLSQWSHDSPSGAMSNSSKKLFQTHGQPKSPPPR